MGLIASAHKLAGGGYSRWWLRGQGEVESFHEKSLVWVDLGVAAQDQGAPVGGREMNIEHLDAGELVEYGSRCEPGGQWLESCPQGDVQAIGHEGDKDVRFDAVLELVVDRTQLKIVLQVFERRLDLGELDVDPLALADHEFWIWLAVVQYADIVEWRFGTTGRHAKPANYGIGQRIENLFFRVWLRAELVKDPKAKDPYHLARTGDQDLWRSHILRQAYANSRLIAKALLRLQAGQLSVKKLTVENVRELAKRLRRLHANVVFEFLTFSQAEGIVLELSSDLKKGK